MCIREVLQSRQVCFEWFLHRPVPGATRFAQSIHEPGRRVAKGVLVRAGDSYVLAVLPATTRIDPAKLAEILNAAELRIATEDEVGRIFRDCERGALPPFGHVYGLPTVVDEGLAEGERIVCVGNQRHEALRLSFADYLAIEHPLVSRFAIPTARPDGHAAHRRAG